MALPSNVTGAIETEGWRLTYTMAPLFHQPNIRVKLVKKLTAIFKEQLSAADAGGLDLTHSAPPRKIEATLSAGFGVHGAGVVPAFPSRRKM